MDKGKLRLLYLGERQVLLKALDEYIKARDPPEKALDPNLEGDLADYEYDKIENALAVAKMLDKTLRTKELYVNGATKIPLPRVRKAVPRQGD